jgi:hypothetical protein
MLVYLQDKSISFYGGANFWKKNFDRQVIEDAKPLIVLQPFGPVMLVYDVYQTVGKVTPKEFIDKGLGQKLFEVKGKLSLETLKSAINKVIDLGIKIKTLSLSELKAGSLISRHNSPLEIILNDKLSVEQNFATLLHELGHLFAGHLGSVILYQPLKKGMPKEIKLPDRKLPESAAELEAETISFLLCRKLGLETRSAEYLAGYIHNESKLHDFSYELVVKTADKIEELILKNIR